MSDVCLILEGTYPYVAGGVSTWVYQLIKRMPEVTFSIVYLGPHRTTEKKLHYPIPDNVIDFREIYLFDYRINRERPWYKGKKEGFRVLEKFLMQMRSKDTAGFEELVRVIGSRETRSIDLHDVVHSYEAWQVIEKMYKTEETENSFIDYFWTWRFLYLPFLSLLRVDLPEARLYHSASTGYAGVLASICKLRFNRPFVLTEHGIYTRERKIEISSADWIYSASAEEIKVREGKEFFREWWISLFSFFSQLTYDRADEIITLYEGNKRTQIEEGADPKKIRIVPNGVELRSEVRSPESQRKKKVRIGFVGRVVPIKDVKTLIKACKLICAEIPDVEVIIMGPVDEDPDYFQECVIMVQSDNLQGAIKFTDKVNVHDYYPKLDLILLTSISEAQPMVILEAGIYRIPTVASNVGACDEMLNGGTPDDRLIGPSGIITPVCDPEATAAAAIKILKDPDLSKRMGQAAHKRILTYYQLNDVIAKYQTLYNEYAEGVRWRA